MQQSRSEQVPKRRVRDLNRRPVRADGEYVLYRMVAARRARWNFALDRAVELAREFDRPLSVPEALRGDYPWAGERVHRFVIEGMGDNARAFRGTEVLSSPMSNRRSVPTRACWVERAPVTRCAKPSSTNDSTLHRGTRPSRL